MASKQCKSMSSSRFKKQPKRNVHTVISSDVMGNRNVEVVPVGAWVEPGDFNKQPDALLSAQLEEEKIRQLKEEKENRLRSFQTEVKQRISKVNKLKREKQLEDAEKAYEQEIKIVQQSLLTGDSSRFNSCSKRQDLDKAIIKRLFEKYGEDVTSWDRADSFPLQSQAEENHNASSKARQQLASKKNETKTLNLGDSEEKFVLLMKNVQNPTVRTHSAPAQKRTAKHCITQNRSELDGCTRTDREVGRYDKSKNERDFENSSDIHESDNTEEYTDDNMKKSEDEIDQPQLTESEVKAIKHILKNKKGKLRTKTSALIAITLRNEAKNVYQERQKKQQAAISRRIFMNREREAVRENIRREEQKKKISSLKREKEIYRQELEDMAQKEMEPAILVLDEMEEERKLKEEFEELQLQKMMLMRKEELRKSREMERYLDALRHSLLEKVRKHNMQLPSLCACGDTVWDTNPDTCANNCFFYKNQRAYARALQSLISSIEVK